jgi:drug/metabolite transporter (DMT)-like permease
MELKNIAIIFPFAAAISWALVYSINGRNYQYLTVPTGLMLMAVGSILAAFLVAAITKTSIDFTPLFKNKDIWLWIAPFAAIFASAFLHLALRHTSASYAALGEVSYVLLTPFFAWLLFGQKQLNTSMAIGALFMLIGLYFVISGQAQKSALPGA